MTTPRHRSCCPTPERVRSPSSPTTARPSRSRSPATPTPCRSAGRRSSSRCSRRSSRCRCRRSPTATAPDCASAPPTTPTTCDTRARARAPCRSPPATPGPSATSCAPCCSPRATTTPTPSPGGRSAASTPTSTAANDWLAEQGFTATRVADATGLSGDNVGTAEELTRLAALVLADPELAAIYETPDSNDFGARNVPDVVDRLGDQGIRAITRSYTDQAGVSFIYSTTVTGVEGDEPRRVIGAMTLIPDYETLDAAVAQTKESVLAAAQPISVIAAGTSYGRVEYRVGRHGRVDRDRRSNGCRVGQRSRRRVDHRREIHHGAGRARGRQRRGLDRRWRTHLGTRTLARHRRPRSAVASREPGRAHRRVRGWPVELTLARRSPRKRHPRRPGRRVSGVSRCCPRRTRRGRNRPRRTGTGREAAR